jgi:hypothetical protein
MSMVIGAQSTASALLTGNTQNNTVAKNGDNTGLRKVAAPANNCNTSAVTFGQTESNPNNAEPRQPIRDHRCEYDVFGANCFNQTENFALAMSEHGNSGYVGKDQSKIISAVAGVKDSKVPKMMESIFGFTPRSGFSDVKVFEYGSAWGDRGGQERTRGDAPAVKVPVPQGQAVCAPDTLYDIGGGEAMVVFATSDRITLHIGRHEYIVGTTNNCGGQHCSGGYWIYIHGINVDTDIVNAYESIRSAQEAAGADLTPISLPIVQAKRKLGTARAQNSITMTIWDDGRMLPLNDNHYWGTNFDDGGTPTNTPPPNATVTPTPNPLAPTSTPATGVPTNTPAQGTPTTAPTATPNPALPCGHETWRYTCGSQGRMVNQAECRGTAYSPEGLEVCPSGTNCPSLEVHYSNTQVEGFAGVYCNVEDATVTPTPDPNIPGMTIETNRIIMTFFGSCSSNPLCNRLTILHGSAYNGRLGQFDSDPGSAASGYSDFGLGEYMGYSVSGNETHFTFDMNFRIHPYDEWKTTTLLLPDPNAGAVDAYVIKP